MRQLGKAALLGGAMAWLTACGGPDTSQGDGGRDAQISMLDGGRDSGPVRVCENDDQCSDGLYCTGVERCMPGEPGTGADGCMAGAPPCEATETCVEDGDRCDTDACSDGGDADGDGDRRPECGGHDCDDANGSVYSTAQEVCDAAGVDEDCDPATIYNDSVGLNDGERDGDGFVDVRCFNTRGDGTENRGTDCDDSRATVNPTAAESCNGLDDNCNTAIDEGARFTFYRDFDGDGYGVGDDTLDACSRPDGYALIGGDCDDDMTPQAPAIHPGQAEACNGIDDDCDGTADTGCACTNGATQSCGPTEAGVGACRNGTQTCAAGVWGACEGDVVPVTETCNGVDDDCDGLTDESVQTTYYRDADGDGAGDPSMPMPACSLPLGYTINSRDCNDSNSAIGPTATEICDDIDNNCDGTRDPDCDCTVGMMRTCGSDVGACVAGNQMCSAAGMWGPCDGETPAGTESCNGLDDNCDGATDEGVLSTFWRDADGDGRGSPSVTTMACTAPVGYVNNSDDCDDGNADRSPVLNEDVYPCDGIDNDCDRVVDETSDSASATGRITCFRDQDGDGYGVNSTATNTRACTCPSGYATVELDCVDTGAQGALIHPGATYQTTGHCNGADPCVNILTGGPGCIDCTSGGACSCRVRASFDYDCNGIAEVQAPSCVAVSHPGPPAYYTCMGTRSPTATHAASECGTSVSYGNCCGGAFDPSMCGPNCSVSSQPLACR